MADAFRIRLAQEELVYLLRALKLPSLPGLGASPLGALDTDHQALALAVADRTLQARGVVTHVFEQQRRLDPIVAGLLQACSQARYLLSFATRHTAPAGVAAILTGFSEGLAVEQSLVAPGIHEFLALGTAGDVIARLQLPLHLTDTPAGPGEPARMRAALLTEALREPHPHADALRLQLHAELPAPTADGVASVLLAPSRLYQLALTVSEAPSAAAAPGAPRAALTIVQSATGLYVFASDAEAGSDASSVVVMPATPAQARAAVERLIQPALDLLPADARTRA